jgi:hypothetical protein
VSPLAIKKRLVPEKLHLDIGCSRLVLQNGKSVTTGELAIPLKSGMPNPEAVAGLRAALIALCATLPARKRVLEITLSDALVRSWIVERLPGLASLTEIEALADAQMRDLYGDDNGDISEWRIRVDATPFAQHWPALALPNTLLDLLIEIAGLHNWQLAKIQTRFVRGFNSWRSNPFKRSKRVVFSLDTPDGLTIAIRNAEQWLALRTHPPLDLLGADLPAMLRRECRAAGLLLDDCQIQTLPWLAVERSA